MTDPSLDPIFDYLREHSGRYSLSALREQLLQTGYDPALVDRAIAIYQHENPPKLPPPVWPKALLVAGINVVLILLGIAALFSANNGDVAPFIGIVFSVIFLGELLGGIALATRQKSHVWGLALVFGFLLTIAIPLLLVGICILIFSQGQWH